MTESQTCTSKQYTIYLTKTLFCGAEGGGGQGVGYEYVSPYVTINPKKMALPKKCFSWFILSLIGGHFSLLCNFPYNRIAKFQIFEHLGGNDIFIIFWNSLSFFEDKKKFYQPADPSLLIRVG